eukprot:Rhum_TRINITY_DN14179_c6_g2::Rhum_TRINITY_DN14179_c6_g2_i1::g.72303::m.72303
MPVVEGLQRRIVHGHLRHRLCLRLLLLLCLGHPQPHRCERLAQPRRQHRPRLALRSHHRTKPLFAAVGVPAQRPQRRRHGVVQQRVQGSKERLRLLRRRRHGGGLLVVRPVKVHPPRQRRLRHRRQQRRRRLRPLLRRRLRDARRRPRQLRAQLERERGLPHKHVPRHQLEADVCRRRGERRAPPLPPRAAAAVRRADRTRLHQRHEAVQPPPLGEGRKRVGAPCRPRVPPQQLQPRLLRRRRQRAGEPHPRHDPQRVQLRRQLLGRQARRVRRRHRTQRRVHEPPRTVAPGLRDDVRRRRVEVSEVRGGAATAAAGGGGGAGCAQEVCGLGDALLLVAGGVVAHGAAEADRGEGPEGGGVEDEEGRDACRRRGGAAQGGDDVVEGDAVAGADGADAGHVAVTHEGRGEGVGKRLDALESDRHFYSLSFRFFFLCTLNEVQIL